MKTVDRVRHAFGSCPDATDDAVATLLGLSQQVVHYHRTRLGIEPAHIRRRWGLDYLLARCPPCGRAQRMPDRRRTLRCHRCGAPMLIVAVLAEDRGR